MRTVDVGAAVKAAREELDRHTYEIVQWHFHPSSGCPFWLDYASKLSFDPLKEHFYTYASAFTWILPDGGQEGNVKPRIHLYTTGIPPHQEMNVAEKRLLTATSSIKI